jgi:hypothetical protein
MLLHLGSAKYGQDHTNRDENTRSTKTSCWRPQPPEDRPVARTIIAYEDAEFGTTYKGKKSSAHNQVYKALRRLAKDIPHIILIKVPEYLTSQICSKCHTRSLEHVLSTESPYMP